MEGLRQISFADFLSERKEKFEPDDERLFTLKKIEKIDFAQGNIHLGKYKPTKTKQIIVEPGDFVFSGLNIEKGAVSINDTGEQLVVSANYSTCRVDYSQIDQRFLTYFMRSPSFKAMLIENLKKDYGFTRPKHLMPLSFTIPASLNEQRSVVERIQCHENEGKALAVEITHQQTLLKKLRQQILQEAIEGKLTADWRAAHPDVEPASELLARIKAEKEALIQAKKIKKQKPLPPITDEEKPFDLPDGWVWCRLGDLSKQYVDCPHDTPKYQGKGFLCLRAPDITENGLLIKTIRRVSKEEYDKRIRRLKPVRNDLVYIREGGRLGIAGLIDTDEPVCLGQRVMMLRFLNEVTAKYSLRFLNAPDTYNDIVGKTIGSASPHVNVRDIIAHVVPVPPLPEQKAIVAKVEKLLAICYQLEAQITQNQTHAEALMQAVLKEAFQHEQADVC